MAAFGFPGYVFHKFGCEPAPMMLGFIQDRAVHHVLLVFGSCGSATLARGNLRAVHKCGNAVETKPPHVATEPPGSGASAQARRVGDDEIHPNRDSTLDAIDDSDGTTIRRRPCRGRPWSGLV
jgi:hypothetical protein